MSDEKEKEETPPKEETEKEKPQKEEPTVEEPKGEPEKQVDPNEFARISLDLARDDSKVVKTGIVIGKDHVEKLKDLNVVKELAAKQLHRQLDDAIEQVFATEDKDASS